MADTTEKTPTIYEAIRHLRECPEQRLESFISERPDGERLGIVRCIDCGESATISENEVLEERERMRKSVSSKRS